MAYKLDLNNNPFEGDFGEDESTIVEQYLSKPPSCHKCNKGFTGKEKVVHRVDAQIDWDFEKISDVIVFYWH